MKYTVKQQLVIATETGSGVLTEICALLNKQRINIQDIYATEEKSKGMLHLIVSDTDAAEKVMREAGFIPARYQGSANRYQRFARHLHENDARRQAYRETSFRMRILPHWRWRHGLILCSTDGDFGRFSGLRWQNPLAV